MTPALLPLLARTPFMQMEIKTFLELYNLISIISFSLGTFFSFLLHYLLDTYVHINLFSKSAHHNGKSYAVCLFLLHECLPNTLNSTFINI